MNAYEKKLEFLDWEYGMFFHFGIRAFYPGHKDWDGQDMPPEKFNPEQLDCEQWIKIAKEAGATYAILTAKHHDGFALWPSKYSNYSVAQTPWKDGKGDVVREFVDACRKHGLKVGLYYSPAQWGKHSVKFESGEEYDNYFISQLGELLTGYGKIDYLWFDGCGSQGHEYDKKRIVAEINKMQPDILTFCGYDWTPGVRWIGNEDGYASLDNPLTINSSDFYGVAADGQELSNKTLFPAECDCRIRETWFYDNNEDTIKSLDELFGMYEMSVGHGSNFLMNIGPDNRGLLPDADTERILELADRIKASYGTPIEFNKFENDGNTYTLINSKVGTPEWKMPYESHLSNCVMISENLTNGPSVRSFSIYGYLPEYLDKKILLFEGKTIGHKVFCKFSPLRCSKYEIVINSCDGDCKIKDIKVFYVK